MPDLIDSIQKIVMNTMKALALTDYETGTVTNVNPLEITIVNSMLQLPQEVLILTEAVTERKLKIEAHSHQVADLSHSHAAKDGQTSTELSGKYDTKDTEISIKCYENGAELPVSDGYVTINRGLDVGDKVIMLRVLGGQNFVVLSRVV